MKLAWLRQVVVVGPLLVCLSYMSCILDEFQVSTSTGPGAGGGGAGGTGGEGACASARWPDAPDETSDADGFDIVTAIRRFDFGEASVEVDGPTIGYDLDEVCTCRGSEGGCTVPADAVANSCDGPGGRDNAVARLAHQGAMIYPDFTSSALSAELEAGEWGALIRVQGYNGLPDDPRVSVAIYPSPGFMRDPCNTAEPAWDGDDRWPVSAFAVGEAGGGAGGMGGAGGNGGAGGGASCNDMTIDPALDAPEYLDENAYVNAGVLVASLPRSALLLSVAPVEARVNLVASFLTARLENSGGRWSLRDGLLVGRWPSSDMLGAMSAIVSGNMPLCRDSPFYASLKSTVCSYIDILSTLAGPTVPCDALSFGLEFDAEPAQLGIVFENDVPPLGCPAGQDPATDSCGN